MASTSAADAETNDSLIVKPLDSDNPNETAGINLPTAQNRKMSFLEKVENIGSPTAQEGTNGQTPDTHDAEIPRKQSIPPPPKPPKSVLTQTPPLEGISLIPSPPGVAPSSARPRHATSSPTMPTSPSASFPPSPSPLHLNPSLPDPRYHAQKSSASPLTPSSPYFSPPIPLSPSHTHRGRNSVQVAASSPINSHAQESSGSTQGPPVSATHREFRDPGEGSPERGRDRDREMAERRPEHSKRPFQPPPMPTAQVYPSSQSTEHPPPPKMPEPEIPRAPSPAPRVVSPTPAQIREYNDSSPERYEPPIPIRIVSPRPHPIRNPPPNSFIPVVSENDPDGPMFYEPDLPFVPPTMELHQPVPKTPNVRLSILSREYRQGRSDSPDRSSSPFSEKSLLQRQGSEDESEIAMPYTYQMLRRNHSVLSVIQEQSDTDGTSPVAQRMNSQSPGIRRPQNEAAPIQMATPNLSYIPVPLDGSMSFGPLPPQDDARYPPPMVPNPGQPRVRHQSPGTKRTDSLDTKPAESDHPNETARTNPPVAQQNRKISFIEKVGTINSPTAQDDTDGQAPDTHDICTSPKPYIPAPPPSKPPKPVLKQRRPSIGGVDWIAPSLGGAPPSARPPRSIPPSSLTPPLPTPPLPDPGYYAQKSSAPPSLAASSGPSPYFSPPVSWLPSHMRRGRKSVPNSTGKSPSMLQECFSAENSPYYTAPNLTPGSGAANLPRNGSGFEQEMGEAGASPEYLLFASGRSRLTGVRKAMYRDAGGDRTKIPSIVVWHLRETSSPQDAEDVLSDLLHATQTGDIGPGWITALGSSGSLLRDLFRLTDLVTPVDSVLNPKSPCAEIINLLVEHSHTDRLLTQVCCPDRGGATGIRHLICKARSMGNPLGEPLALGSRALVWVVDTAAYHAYQIACMSGADSRSMVPAIRLVESILPSVLTLEQLQRPIYRSFLEAVIRLIKDKELARRAERPEVDPARRTAALHLISSTLRTYKSLLGRLKTEPDRLTPPEKEWILEKLSPADIVPYLQDKKSHPLVRCMALRVLRDWADVDVEQVPRWERLEDILAIAVDVLLWRTNWQHGHEATSKSLDIAKFCPHDDAYRVITSSPAELVIPILSKALKADDKSALLEPLLSLIVDHSKLKDKYWPFMLSMLLHCGCLSLFHEILLPQVPPEKDFLYRKACRAKTDACIGLTRCFEQMRAKDVRTIPSNVGATLVKLANDEQLPLNLRGQAGGAFGALKENIPTSLDMPLEAPRPLNNKLDSTLRSPQPAAPPTEATPEPNPSALGSPTRMPVSEPVEQDQVEQEHPEILNQTPEPGPEAQLPDVPSEASSFPMAPPEAFDGGTVIPQQFTGSQYTGSQQHPGSQQYGIPRRYGISQQLTGSQQYGISQQNTGSQQYGMSRQYDPSEQYMSAGQYPGSQQHTGSHQTVSQSYAGYSRMDTSVPVSPFIPSLDHMPASTPYVPPVNLVTANLEQEHPEVPNQTRPRHGERQHKSILKKQGAVFPAPAAVASPPPVITHRSGGGYGHYESAPLQGGYVYRTPGPSAQALPQGLMTPHLTSRPGTADPWANAPEGFLPPTSLAGAAAVASPRTAISVLSKDFKTPRTIFEPISSDQSSIYNPNSPDQQFHSLGGATPGPQYAGLQGGEDDEEDPAPFIPNGTDGSSFSFIPSGIPSGSGASMSRSPPALRKPESVMGNTPRVSVHSVTDEDEPKVVPVVPPREPTPPPPSPPRPFRRGKGKGKGKKR